MGTGWDYASKVAEKVSGGGKWIKLENDGDKVVGIFVGEPHVEEVVFNEATRRTEPFNSAHAAEGKRPTAKFSFNFYTSGENGADVEPPQMRIFQCNARTFKSIVKVRDKYGLENWAFEIERKGEKGDPATTYMVLPDAKVAEDVRATLAKAVAAHERYISHGTPIPDGLPVLNTLARLDGDGDVKAAAAPAPTRHEDPKAASRVAEIRDRLKQRPRADLDAFLAHFGVAMVKDLKSSDVPAALAFVERLEKVGSTPANADPFAD